MNAAPARVRQWKPALTAIIAGGLAGLVAILTYQLMLLLQHLIWETAAPEDGVGPVRIVLTILTGGALLLLLARLGPSESVDELLGDSDSPLGRTPRKILVTALVAIVSIAFGGAIGPEAGLLAVVAECSVIVSRFIARDEAQARAIAQAGVAGALGGLYGSPPAAAAIDRDGESLAPSRIMSFVAGISGFLVFLFVARTVFGGQGMAEIPLPEAQPGEAWLVIVPVLAGAAFGILFRMLHHGADGIAARIGKPWLVTIIGTVLFAALAAAIPLVRFSGHHELLELPALLADGASGELWLLAAAKLVAMILCLVAGWRGGEVFPLIFIGAAAGAGTALLLPGVDPAAAVAGAMAATLAVGWRRPLAALLVLVLVVDVSAVMPLLLGVGVGIALDRLIFPQPAGEED